MPFSQNFFIPEEFLIIAAALKLHKNIVSLDEIKKVIDDNSTRIEYSDKPFSYCTFNEKDTTYTVTLPSNINMSILSMLTNL